MKKCFLVFFFLFLLFPLFCEQVYDSSGRLIRSSQWLQRTEKPQTVEPAKDIEEVVIEQQEEEEPLVQDQQSMKEKNIVADKVYSSNDLEKSHASNLPSFLQEKGFLIMSSGGEGTKTELSYKGFTAFCIKVYVDGILANNPTTGEFDWNSIDINSIESIVVSETPQIGISEFAGCSVFITTKGHNTAILTTDTSLNSYENNFLDGVIQTINYSTNVNNFYFRIGATSLFSDNEYNTAINQNKFNFSKMAGLNFSWNYNWNENLKFTGADTYNFNQVKAFGTSDALSSGLEEDYTSQNNITMTYEKNNFRSQTIFSYFYGQVDYLNNFDSSGKDITTTNMQNISLRQNISSSYIDVSTGIRQEHLFSSEGDRLQLDLGFSHEFNFNNFSLDPCLQFLYYDFNNFEFLPRLTIQLFDMVTISGYRLLILPTFNQLYWPESGWSCGNPNLNPEQGWSVTASFKKNDFPIYGRFTYSYYENKIRWASVDGKLMPSNTANANYYVLVAGYDKSFLNNMIDFQIDGTMTQARLCETGKQIMWVPQFQIHSSISFNYKSFSALVDYSWTGKRYESNLNISAYPDFHLLDLILSYKINDEFMMYGKVKNLLDQRVVYHDNYYIPSRMWTIGFTFKK